MKSWPFKVIRGTNDVPMIVVSHASEEKKFSAVEILSMFLKNLKDVAEDYLGRTIAHAVITVPPVFYNSRRQAVKEAGQVAGLNVLQIISEPVAAATANGLHIRTDIAHETTVLIFDLGRSTLDVSLVSIDKNGTLEVKAFSSDSKLGGEHFDTVMLRLLVTIFVKKYKSFGIQFNNLDKLRHSWEDAKKLLSSTTELTWTDGFIQELIITREQFETYNILLFDKCIDTVKKCLRDARINKEDVDEAVLVGGSTRIPKVQQLLREFFNGKELCTNIDPSEATAIGAAVVAEKLSREKCQKAKNLVLPETVPLSLGVDAHDGTLSVIVPRNTPIPAKKERIYFTRKDDQESIYFNVYQGERSKAKENNLLGSFEVVVPPAPRGKSKVKVVFSIDVDGILNCWVKELTTGLNKNIVLNEKQLVLKEEIEKMLKDAENYKVEDQEYKKKVFAHNALEEYVYNVKRKVNTIKSNNMMIPHNEDILKIDNAIKSASQYLDLNELAHVDEYQNKLNELEKLCVPIIAQLL